MKNIREIARSKVSEYIEEHATYLWGNDAMLGFFVGHVFKELGKDGDNVDMPTVIKITREELETVHAGVIEDEEGGFTVTTLSKGGPIISGPTREEAITTFERGLELSRALFKLEGFKRTGKMRKWEDRIIYYDLHG